MMKADLSKQVKDFVVPSHTVMRLDQTVDDVLKILREHKIEEKIIYLYAVDKHFRLKGIVSTRSLILSAPTRTVQEIMEHDLISISAKQTMKDALETLTKHRLLAVPVVDEDTHLMGMIEIQLFLEGAMNIYHKKNPTDIFHILGVAIEEGKMQSAWSSFRIRMPWLCCNLVGGTACAIISHHFELILAKVLLLAMFIPLVLTLSEAISMQSMSYSIQNANPKEISWKSIIQRVFHEGKMVILIAITCGFVVGGLSLFWGGGTAPALTLLFGVGFSVLTAASLGAAIPLLLHLKKFDPKLAAGPIVLMFVDVLTTTIYLALATWWLL